MRIFALELDNDIKGPAQRMRYMESLIAALPEPDLVVLPELSLCGYLASPAIWQYADPGGREAARWAVRMARRYGTYVGAGYLDKENGDYYNRYLIAGPDGVYGVVTKSEGESAVFKRGRFGSIITTPFGNVGAAICYDAKRKLFYDNVKDQELSLILFPHGCPASPDHPDREVQTNDYFCGVYEEAFCVPVVYVNSVGVLSSMPGLMGRLMAMAGFRMNGKSKIYSPDGSPIACGLREAVGADVEIRPQRCRQDIRFYGEDLIRGNWFFRHFVLKPDCALGIRAYERNRRKAEGQGDNPLPF